MTYGLPPSRTPHPAASRGGSPGERDGPGSLLWSGRLAEQVGQFGFDVDVVALVAGRDDLVGPAEEVGNVLDRRLEVRLAERGGQLDVQHVAGSVGLRLGRRPDVDVALALAALGPRGQQVPRENPLHRLIKPDVKRDADGVG